MRRIAALLLVVGVVFSPNWAFAQQRIFPAPVVAEIVAGCVTERFGASMTGPAWVEEWPGQYRVVVPLRGQPDAEHDVQNPLPTEDTLSWFILQRYEHPYPATISSHPYGAEGIWPETIEIGLTTYVTSIGGYPSHGAAWNGQRCLLGALNAL